MDRHGFECIPALLPALMRDNSPRSAKDRARKLISLQSGHVACLDANFAFLHALLNAAQLGYPCIQLSKNTHLPAFLPTSETLCAAALAGRFRAGVVEMIGLEPTTSGLQSQRSPS